MKSKRFTVLADGVRAAKAKPYVSCTQAMVLGLTSQKGNMNGQNGDEAVSEEPWKHISVKLVIPEEGYRYLSHERCAGEVPTVNEKGVSATHPGRFPRSFPPYPGKADYLSREELMRTSGSAKEYVQKWAENFTKYGGNEDPANEGRTIVDPKEGYYIEGLNFVYGDPANHNIQGPMTDMVFAAGNFFVTKRFKQYEEGIGAGYTRAKRVWQMLIDRQYDCAVEGWEVNGIALPYFMSIWRDHGNISPEEQRMSTYVPEERGALTVCCHGIEFFTSKSIMSVSVEQHTNLLSCMWMTFGLPCISPFLPFYIGINAVPEIVSTSANPVARVFENLRLVLEYHPEYRAEITRYFTVFELQTVEQTEILEAEVTKLADDGRETEARTLLTEFVEKKCAEAMSAGSQWLEFLKSLTLTPKAASEEE